MRRFCARCDANFGGRECRRCRCGEWSLSPRVQVEALVSQNLKLIHLTLHRRIYAHLPLATINRIGRDEFESAAGVGLVYAARRFDVKRGFAFSTYAIVVIQRAVWRLTQSEARRVPTQSFVEGGDEDKAAAGDFDAVDDQDAAAVLLAALPERERFIVKSTIVDGMTLTQAGRVLGITGTRAGQIRKRALQQLAG